MVLSNHGIREALASKALTISPAPSDEQYTTSAVDLTLGSDFRCWDYQRLSTPGIKVDLDLATQKFHSTAASFLTSLDVEKDGSVVFPPYNQRPYHILAQTRERVSLDLNARLAARVEGRSSLARLGLAVHLTAPTIHSGFSGNITLEMVNFGPFYLRLVPGNTRICQLILERLETDPIGEIQTNFQGQTTPSGQ